MTQAKMETYMDRHKLGPLFEDLMNRVLRDMPEEPFVYLLRTLYKKAGMEIPQDIRYGGLRKSVDLAARSRSPERHIKSADPNSTSASKEYEKPWKNPRNVRPRRSGEGHDTSPTKTSKKKPDWQGDCKITTTSFDELWQGQGEHGRDASPGKKSRLQKDTRSSWAVVGLESGDTFTNGAYHGPSHRTKMNEEDLLAAETVRSSGRDDKQTSEVSAQLRAVSGVRGQRSDLERHRCDLKSMLQTEERRYADETVADDDVEDEALELLEDADDLKREGVKNIPKSGYKLSKIMRSRSNEPCVKLNINLSPRGDGLRSVDSLQSMEGYDSDNDSPSQIGRRWETDDEFESVSQVTGPRVPVWQIPDSDGETAVRHSSSYRRHRKLPKYKQDLSASSPAALQQVAFSAGDLDIAANQTWSPGLQVQAEESSPEPDLETDLVSRRSGRSGGWDVPEDSDAASVQDWNQRVKGAKRDLRSY